MLKYLVIDLDYSSVSYCHYNKHSFKHQLIKFDDLKSGILYAMKQNLYVQFVYPEYDLPDDYTKLIETIDHIKIKPSSVVDDSVNTITVINGLDLAKRHIWIEGHTYVLRISRTELSGLAAILSSIEAKIERVNIVLTDIEDINESDLLGYMEMLESLKTITMTSRITFQTNVLTDRLFLDKMNNCNAGDEVITLAPNGRFYICPGFFYDNSKEDCGSPQEGLIIKNRHLYKWENAPICKHCDAYQCKRCVWLNKKLTLECNTPSHEQCVLSHLERNASRQMLQSSNQTLNIIGNDIPEIDYLDPFEDRLNWEN
jgi:CXXX repeat peptide maturase